MKLISRILFICVISIPYAYIFGALFWLGLANTLGAGLFAAFIIWYLTGSLIFRGLFALIFPLPWTFLFYLGLSEGQALEQLFLTSSLIGYYLGGLIMIMIKYIRNRNVTLMSN